MKKIMFNDQYALTDAVLEGKKTQEIILCKEQVWSHSDIINAENGIFHFERPKYEIGEVIAVAQSYKDCGGFMDDGTPRWNYISQIVGNKNGGWSNKMLVRPELMPHQIRVKRLSIQRLKDISDEDCLAEGVVVVESKLVGGVKSYYPCEYLQLLAKEVGWGRVFDTPREAYATLIDETRGKGTWENNPYVWVYDFELIK